MVAEDSDATDGGTARGLFLEGYQEVLDDLKEWIRSTQLPAALSASRELILLYRQVGHAIEDWQ